MDQVILLLQRAKKLQSAGQYVKAEQAVRIAQALLDKQAAQIRREANK